MNRIFKKDKPEGCDPEEDIFGDSWKTKFCKRWKISTQKKNIIKQSQSTNGFIKFQTITIMPYIKQGPSLCNQIYLSKHVFVNTTKSFKLFMFTFVKIQNCFLGLVTHIYLLQ